MKALFSHIKLIILANVLFGCSTQFVQPNEANALQEFGEQSSSVVPFISPDQENMYKLLVAELAGQRGQFKVSVDYFIEAAKSTAKANIAERATKIALYAKEYGAAVEAAKLWVNLSPKNPEARQILGRLLLHENRPEEAVVHFEVMLDNLKAGDEEQELEIVTSLLQQKDHDAALKLMERLAAKRHQDPTALLMYSRLLLNAKQDEKGLQVLEQLLKLKPDHERAVLLYALTLQRLGQDDQALAWIQKALAKHPDNHVWRLIYAQMLSKAKRYNESISQFKQLLYQQPNSPDVLQALAILSLQLDDIGNAKYYLIRLLKAGEQDTASFLLGQIAELEQDQQTALGWYYKITNGENYLNAQMHIANILAEQGSLEEALNHLRSVPIEEDEEEALSLMQLEAQLLTDYKRYQEAIDVYNEALVLYPDNLDLLYMRAMVAEKVDRLDILEQDLRHVLTLDPKHINAINALGYTLADRTTRYEEAYELVKQALALEPDAFHILDSMGWVLYRLGKYTESVTYLKKALATQYDPEVAAHLGEVLWISGDKQEATRVWQKALREFPEDEVLQKATHRFLK